MTLCSFTATCAHIAALPAMIVIGVLYYLWGGAA